MMEKVVVFFAVDGLEAQAFMSLWQCFGDLNASSRIASVNADMLIRSSDRSIDTKSDLSFNSVAANPESFDVFVIADGVTANAIQDNDDAIAAISAANDNNAAIVCIADACAALGATGILDGLTVAAPPEMAAQLQKYGAQISDDSVYVNGNIFTARKDADMRALCDLVSEFITGEKVRVA